jgi:hypothetical protein
MATINVTTNAPIPYVTRDDNGRALYLTLPEGSRGIVDFVQGPDAYINFDNGTYLRIAKSLLNGPIFIDAEGGTQ